MRTLLIVAASIVIAIGGVSSASAAERSASATDPVGDASSTQTSATPPPTADFVSARFAYDDSGTYTFQAVMAAAIDQGDPPIGISFEALNADASGKCTRLAASAGVGKYGQSTTGRDAAGPFTPASMSVQREGAKLTIVVSDPRLANQNVACLTTNATWNYSNDGVNDKSDSVDRVYAIVAGFESDNPQLAQPATKSETTTAVTESLTPTGSGAKLGAILRNGGYTETVDAPAPGTDQITWTATSSASGARAAKRVVIATGKATAKTAGPFAVKIRLTKAGKAMIKRAKSALKVTVTGSFTPLNGPRVAKSKVVRLRR